MPRMSYADVMKELKSDSWLNRARAKFSSGAARIDQESRQRTPPGPIEVRRLEFEVTREVLQAYGTVPERDVTLSANLAAMEMARSELDSIHSQYGDQANARDHSAALRLLDEAISGTKYALGL